MADRDAGSVSIRFSVKDAETVRQALERLGKDGQRALAQLDAASRQATPGQTAIAKIVDDLRSRVLGLAVPLGSAGQALIALGPVGLAAATALGGLVGAFDRIREGAQAFRAMAREIKDGAEMSGVGIEQYQALIDLVQRHGVESEKARNFLNRFNVSRAEAVKGSGDLYQALRQEDAALARQFASAKSTAEALEILARVIGKVDQVTRASILNAAGGRGAQAVGPALLELAQQGFEPLIEEAKKLGFAIDENLVKKQAAAAVEAERKSKIVETAWNQAYAAIFEKWKNFKAALGFGPAGELSLAVRLRALFTGETLTPDEVPLEKLRGNLESARQRIDKLQSGPRPDRANIQHQIRRLQQQIENINREIGLRETAATVDVPREPFGPPEPTAEQSKTAKIAAFERETLAPQRERIGLLGDSATAAERAKLANDELTLAVMKGAQVSETDIARRRESIAVQETAGEVARRTALGVATEEERRSLTVRQLGQDVSKGTISEEQRTAALALYNKTLKDTIDQETIRRSNAPELTRFSIESQNLMKAVEQAGAQAFGRMNDGIVDVITGTKGLKQSFHDLASSIARDLLRIAINRAILGPLAGGLSSLFGGVAVASARGNVFDAGRVIPFAEGGVLTGPMLFPLSSGLGLAGERGAEAIMPLKRIDGRLGVEAVGARGVGVTVAPVMNVSVTMPPGGRPEDGRAFGAEAAKTIRTIVVEEILRQRKSGGALA